MPPPRIPSDFAPATGPEPSLWDTMAASFQDAQVKNTDEESRQLDGATDAAWEKLIAAGGEGVKTKLWERYKHIDRERGGQPELNGNPWKIKRAALDAYRAELGEAERQAVPTIDQLVERGREASIARYYEAQDVLSRSSGGILQGAAGFAGGAAGAMTDPVNIASMIALRYPAQGILATIGIEAAGGALTQAVIEPQTYSYMNDLGIEYGLEDSVNAILQAGVGAGVMGGVWRAGEKAVVRAGGDIPIDELRAMEKRANAGDSGAAAELRQYTIDRIRKAVAKAGVNADPDARAADAILQEVETIEAENPFEASMPRPATFKTAKGSTYEVGEGGVTTRNKAFRPEHGEAEQGLQPTSEATFYVTPEQAHALSEIQTRGDKRAIVHDGNGNWAIKYLEGKDAGKVERRTIIKPATEPAVGLMPVELWKDGTRVHFGNEIVEVTPAVDADVGATAEAMARHQTEVIRADETLQHGRPVTPARGGDSPPLSSARTPEGVELVDLSTLQRAPELFQYKDADVDGTTQALRGIDTWAPERAGLVIAWERKDGQRFVVDGHQRHALAQRLTEQGHAPISAPVFVLREADGVTATQAMNKAAAKNIGEGSGTALDAAHILRTSPAEDLRGLPPNSALVKAAAGLARLSDDAFGMVLNGADERWGALVGRLVDDQALQAQVLKAIGRLDPSTPAAAESMIRDMLQAPRVEAETLDLFGASTTSELLIAERAKVKAAAVAALSKNKQGFRVVLQRQAELEAAGNRLAAQRNREALDADTAAALRLEKDAHLKGWVSDALSQAAKDLRDGASLQEVTGRLVESLRRGERPESEGGTAARGAGQDDGRPGAAGRAGEGGGSQAKRSPETLKVDLGRSSWRKAQDGADTVDVLVNPTDAALKRLTVLPAEARKDGKTSSSLRYLKDDAGNLFVWRGDLAVHPEIAAELKLDADGATPAQGKVELADGKLLWDGVPDRPGAPASKKALREGGAIAWRRELIRDDAMTDDLERVLSWLSGERKEVVAEVRDSFLDEPPASGLKADLMTELRDAVRAHHVKRGEGAEIPPSLFDADPDVARMREAENALRTPIADEGASIGAGIEAESAGPDAARLADEATLDAIETTIRDLRKLEESDPRLQPQMFIDPETGKLRPVADLLDEIDYDRNRTKVLEFCAYPGGKGAA